MIISYRYKLGKCISKPLPRCRFCGEYTVYRKGVIDRDYEYRDYEYLDCPKCGATFDVIRKEKKE